MAVKEWIPYTNIEASDVRDTLNANGGSVTNDVTTFFSSDANIDRFARYKPVVYSKPFCQNQNSSMADYYPDWYKGDAGDCGLTPYKFSTSPKTELDASVCDWSYLMPAGGSSQPWRLGDFAGYQPNVPPPIYLGTTSYRVNIEESSDYLLVTFDAEYTRENERALNISDFSKFHGVALSSFYFKCKIYKKGTSTLVWSGTASGNILEESQGNAIAVPISVFQSDLGYNESVYYDIYVYFGTSDDAVMVSVQPFNGSMNVKQPLSLQVYHQAGSVYKTVVYIGYARDGEWKEDNDMMADDGVTELYYLKIRPAHGDGMGWFKVNITNGSDSALDVNRGYLSFFWNSGAFEPYARSVTYMYVDGTSHTSYTLASGESKEFVFGVAHAYYLDSNESYSPSNVPADGDYLVSWSLTNEEGFVFANSLSYSLRIDNSYTGAGEFIEA